ncbi:MAG: hypothetical protein A2506_11595 [Elusimicrobia bacterium RIFOXYD12_FULL_66_9]|nr:MAG: hypothetical protein A2506_11595 [Elusimicrobia bacterium RIFOXYD12_FULL_66_9]
MASALAFGALAGLPAKARAALCEAITTPGGSKESALRESMRTLWVAHVIWGREYIVATLWEDPDQTAVAARLWRNQEEIGALFATYYGEAVGTQLADVLKRHILISADVVDALKTGQDGELHESQKRWQENAGELVVLLSGVNPKWSKQALADVLGEHMALTTKETAVRLKKKKADDDIVVFDQLLAQARDMADEFSDGIIKQLPREFE